MGGDIHFFEAVPFRACWMRGGTSKGVFFLEKELPSVRALQDEIILSALGSPDVFGTQMDGLGGATSSTSKAAIISISERVDCDINYRFAHVSVIGGVVDYSGNCGNLSAAVGLYALEEKLVKTRPKKAVVSVWQ
jgi:2-methylaconitate cis-trans-isomerase PrpF